MARHPHRKHSGHRSRHPQPAQRLPDRPCPAGERRLLYRHEGARHAGLRHPGIDGPDRRPQRRASARLRCRDRQDPPPPLANPEGPRGRQSGVFAAQHGHGIENAFPGVAQAYSENVPMLIIPAGFPPERQYIRPTFRAAEVYRSVTKWSAMAHGVQELPDLMRRAFHALRSGKGGPVLLEVPNEVFEATYQGTLDYVPVPILRTAPDPDLGKEAARALLAAKHPLLWAGQRVHYAQSAERLAALAELVSAPVVATNPGESALPDSHPLALGAATRSRSKMFAAFMARADLVLAIGSSLTKTSFGPGVPAGKTIIHSTTEAVCINKDYSGAQSLIGDAALVLDALIAE